MSILARIASYFGFERASLNNPSTPINGETLSNGFPSSKSVSADDAFAITTFWRACQILSGVLASMPLEVYRVTETTSQKDRSHAVSKVLRLKPNPFLSRFDFVQILVTQLVTYGNFYARIDRNGRTAYPERLSVLDPERMKIVARGRGIVYEYMNDEGETVPYTQDRILHVSGMSRKGIEGMRTLKIFQGVFKAAQSNQEYITAFYQNGAQLSGVLSIPDKLTPEAYERLRNSWAQAYSGPKRSGATAILEAGAKYEKVGLSPTDAAFTDTRSAIIADISRITGVPPFLLSDLDRATFNNIEHLGTMFVNFTVMPIAANIEAEFSRKLLKEDEQSTHEIKFDLAYLLRADAEGRAKLIDSLMKWGIINRDEARQIEGLNPIADGSGQAYYIPMNMFDPTQGVNPNTDQ